MQYVQTIGNPSSHISVVTVVRNDRQALERTARSVSRQMGARYEWIVVDGASTDDTAELIRELAKDGPATTVLSEPDVGLYDAMNKGVRLSHGRHVVFLNAGDEFASVDVLETVQRHIDVADERADPTIYYGDWWIRLPGGECIRRTARSGSYARYSMPASHQSMFFPRAFLIDHPYDLHFRICADYHLVATAFVEGINFESVGTDICIFELGGVSTWNTSQQIREATCIHRTVIRAPLVLRMLFSLRLIFSTLAARTLTNWSLLRSRTGNPLTQTK